MESHAISCSSPHSIGSRALMTTAGVYAADGSPRITVGTQEVGLTAGYLLPHRLTQDHTTKQQGLAFMPSSMMTITDPVGNGW